ncbi:hypothetical protein V501_02109 [Pseudogymnoascus sp. VKM F-4519 (FW-2642)]|nr:hypothetical protein V501_02109 [Pseudogymnoascus sp. VKM F-4519 (FW-2642)]
MTTRVRNDSSKTNDSNGTKKINDSEKSNDSKKTNNNKERCKEYRQQGVSIPALKSSKRIAQFCNLSTVLFTNKTAVPKRMQNTKTLEHRGEIGDACITVIPQSKTGKVLHGQAKWVFAGGHPPNYYSGYSLVGHPPNY